MSYRVELSPGAAKQLKKLFKKQEKSVRDAIRDKIDDLEQDPRPHGCEKLSGYDQLYRVRVGEYRIVYAVSDRLVLVLVLKIGDRAEVYERIRSTDLAKIRDRLGF